MVAPLGAVATQQHQQLGGNSNNNSGGLQHGHSSNSLGRTLSVEHQHQQQQMHQQQHQQHHQQQQQIPIGFADEYYANPADLADLGQSEHYIYVTYPPELKRRLLERYGKEVYLMLLKKDTMTYD